MRYQYRGSLCPQPSLCVQCTFLLNGSAWIKEKNYLVKRFKIVCKIESNIFWFVNLSKNWFQKCIVEHLIFWKSLLENKNPMKCYSSNYLHYLITSIHYFACSQYGCFPFLSLDLNYNFLHIQSMNVVLLWTRV